MIEFTSETMDEILASKPGDTVEGEVVSNYRYDDAVPMTFTIVGHELETGIETGSNNPIRIITTLRNDTKLVKIGFDIVSKPGYGYDMTNCEVVNEENI